MHKEDGTNLVDVLTQAVMSELVKRGMTTQGSHDDSPSPTPSLVYKQPASGLISMKFPDVIWGDGSCSKLSEVIAHLGRRPAIVVDKGVFDLGLHKQALRSLEDGGREVPVFGSIMPEPDDNAVDEVVSFMRRCQPDVIVAMGGGSAMDVAKAAIVAFENEGSLMDYSVQGGQPIPRRRTGLTCIPTTSGSGSEATSVSVIIDSSTGIKMLLNSPSLMPDVALIDSGLTRGLPPKVAAACGMDALTHAIEGKCNISANPMTDSITLAAIKLIMDSLEDAVKPNHHEARERLALGSTMAAMGFSNCGVGACHAIAHQVGTMMSVPHGVANAVLLPHVLMKNCSKAPGRCIGLPSPEALTRLSETTGLPTRLREAAGVKVPDKGTHAWYELAWTIVDADMQDVCMAGNPVPLSRSEVLAIIDAAW